MICGGVVGCVCMSAGGMATGTPLPVSFGLTVGLVGAGISLGLTACSEVVLGAMMAGCGGRVGMLVRGQNIGSPSKIGTPTGRLGTSSVPSVPSLSPLRIVGPDPHLTVTLDRPKAALALLSVPAPSPRLPRPSPAA